MKKMKCHLLLAVAAVVTCLVGCGNSTFIDTTYTFNYAQIKLPDGTVVEGKLKQWCDYDGDSIQLVMEDGVTYYVHMGNAAMMTEKPE